MLFVTINGYKIIAESMSSVEITVKIECAKWWYQLNFYEFCQQNRLLPYFDMIKKN